MCCYEHRHFGPFEEGSNRRVAFAGVAVVEIVDRCFLASLAAIEFSPAVRGIFSRDITLLVVFFVIHTTTGLLHCSLFHGPPLKYPQLTLLLTSKVSFVLLCLAILNTVRIESWESTGLLTFIFLTIAFIKFCSMLIACFSELDMTGNWAYLSEFATSTVTIITMILVYQFAMQHGLLATSIVGAVIGSFLSQLSLLDLHQNMRLNYWWWEDRMINGCVYHVVRQYTFTCCKRIEQQPRTTRSDENPRQRQED